MSGSAPGLFRRVARAVETSFVGALAMLIVCPAVSIQNPIQRVLARVGLRQHWRMYAPDPQRSHAFMELTAQYRNAPDRPLLENEATDTAWQSHNWGWTKTRFDIWRHYVNFNPKHRNRDRDVYLRAICVREARLGPIPHRIVMYQLRRSFTPPNLVHDGASGLGPVRRELVTVVYCEQDNVRAMITEDRLRRGLSTP